MRPPTERRGVTADLAPLPGGHRNRVFRTLGLARDLVFKSTRRTDAGIGWLTRVHRAARRAGFVVPDPVRNLDGRLVAGGWTCETFVDGTGFAPGDMPDLLSRIRAFHAATEGLPQRPGVLSSRALLDRTTGGDIDLDAMPAALVSRCRAAWRAVADRGETVIHGDLVPGNLLRCPDGGIALLDWDECRRDLKLFDPGALDPEDDEAPRARLAWEVACCWQIEPDRARNLAPRL